jgi:outer membrane cobalamin receptor
LILEDGIPTRPSGFCNTNQLIEVNAEQAQSIEVIRGPANALFGSNALHGIVNVLMPEPGTAGQGHAGIELGSNNYFRARATLPFKSGAPKLVVRGRPIRTGNDGDQSEAGYRRFHHRVQRIRKRESQPD